MGDRTDGQGPIQTGSVVTRSDGNIAGFILYQAGSLGLAGVGASSRLRKSVVPIETASGYWATRIERPRKSISRRLGMPNEM